MPMHYELIDHTADFGIHVFGSDSTDLFANAALAMFDLIAEMDTVAGRNAHFVQITGDDWPDLMVNWLRELLYFWSGRELLITAVDIQAISEKALSATILTAPYDPDRHVVKTEIKAVTYHQIQVESGPSGWEAKIIFDV